MSSPAVTCSACAFAWNSTAMADGLRALGSCPRCGGELRFHTASRPAAGPAAAPPTTRPPHLVLGLPRL